MSYRNQTIRPIPRPCTVCEADETSACARCDRPLCDEHALAEGAVCSTCAEHSHDTLSWFAIVVMPLVLIGALAGLAMAYALWPDVTAGWEIVWAVFGAGVLTTGVRLLLGNVLRRRFSGKRQPRRWPTRAQLDASFASEGGGHGSS
ncbi:MAG: hypothetical protein KC503_43115 [Myxococcales bacterium]|nr:hypothetical protein [Myxococcales bacterium]